MARRWLGAAHGPGAQIYGPEIFDSNPPGIVWLSAIPVLLSRWLHLPVTLLAKSLVVLAETGASLLSLNFLRRGRIAESSQPPQLSADLPSADRRSSAPSRSCDLPALLFTALVLFCVVPARDFGQRDQILSFLVVPYVLAAAISPRQQRLTLARCAAGILAAAGICLKPHHALIPIAVELALLLAPSAAQTKLSSTDRLRRLLRPEPILIGLLGLAYLAAIYRVTPLYFTLALPVLRETYWAIGHLSIPALALQAIELCALAGIVIALFLAVPPRSAAVGLLIVAGSAAAVVYFVQGTGWYYQQLPAISFFGLAMALELLYLLGNLLRRRESAKPLKLPNRIVPAVAALCTLALALTTYFSGSPFTRDRAYAAVFADPTVPDAALFASLPPHTSVAILTTSVEAAMMPVERFHLTWAQRTDNLWLMPAILRSETALGEVAGTPASRPDLLRRIAPARLDWLERLQHRWMVEDLTRWHPELIVVARCQSRAVPCQELEDIQDSKTAKAGDTPVDAGDLLSWFLRDPAFAALWSHYRYSGSRGDYDAYILR